MSRRARILQHAAAEEEADALTGGIARADPEAARRTIIRKGGRIDHTAREDRDAAVTAIRGDHQRASADLGQVEATAVLIEPGYGERIGIHADNGVGAQREASAVVAPDRQGVVSGEAADGAEAADAGAPDMHVLIKADATAQGERATVEDVGHGGSVPPADTERGVVRDQQHARVDVRDTQVIASAGEYPSAYAALGEVNLSVAG